MAESTKRSKTLLDIGFIGFIVAFVGFGMWFSITTATSLAHKREEPAPLEHAPVCVCAGEWDGDSGIADLVQDRIRESETKLALLKVELGRKEIQLASVTKEITELDLQLKELRFEIIRAHLFKIMSDALEGAIRRANGSANAAGSISHAREIALQTCRATRATTTESSPPHIAATLVEEYIRTTAMAEFSGWNDLVGLMDWYSSRAQAGDRPRG